jgi:hypothetical protein
MSQAGPDYPQTAGRVQKARCRRRRANEEVPDGVRALNRRIIINNDSNPWQTGAGAVSKDEQDPNAQEGIGRRRALRKALP